MHEAGMTTRIDNFANLIGRLEGTSPELPAISAELRLFQHSVETLLYSVQCFDSAAVVILPVRPDQLFGKPFQPRGVEG